jgi:hypothetical protein
MRRIFAIGILALCSSLSQAPVEAAEGRVHDSAAPTLDENRVSRYTRAEKPDAADSKARARAGSAKTHSNTRIATAPQKRPLTQSMSAHASHIYIYDAGSALLTDADHDGYHREFRIRFDADSVIGDVLVFARLYLRRVGDADWLLYHTTDDFWIYGQSGSDDYFVTTTLDDGFPTSEYDVLIDLYEVGFPGIVATFGPFDSGALTALPLEEAGLDVPIELPGFRIGEVTTTLLTDDDADGHYSSFEIELDPDADFDGSYVYARFWVRPQGGEWIEEFVSGDFLVDSSGTQDVYTLTAEWISGYPTAYYDIQIDLFEASSDLLVASVGSERPELSRVPLEDEGRDRRPNPPSVGDDGGDTSSREHGGGALTLEWVLGLLALALLRRKARR